MYPKKHKILYNIHTKLYSIKTIINYMIQWWWSISYYIHTSPIRYIIKTIQISLGASVWGLARGDESRQRKGVGSRETIGKTQWVEPGRNRGNHPCHPDMFLGEKRPGFLRGKKTWTYMVKNGEVNWYFLTNEFCTDFIQHHPTWGIFHHVF